MSRAGKIATILLILLILFFLFSSTIIYYSFTNEKTKATTLKNQLQQAQKNKNESENKLKAIKIRINSLDNQLAKLRIKNDDLLSQYNTEKTVKNKILIERDRLIGELESKTALLYKTKDELVKSQKDISSLGEKIAKLQIEDSEKKTQKKVVVSAEMPGGEIIKINKKHSFVVVSLGKKNGIKIKQTLYVYRQQKLIGSIETINVKNELSTANLLPGTKIRSLRKGDKVLTSNES